MVLKPLPRLSAVRVGRYKTCNVFIVGPPLDARFEMDLEADASIWHSDINLVIFEDRLQDFEGRSW
jgi:hypothetical protein